MTEIVNTGERIILEKETPLMIARHFCAYRFTKDYILNKQVLDIGCGEGYGSYYLADLARRVTAIDYDSAIINYAKNKYHKDNLRFEVMDVKDLGVFNDKFDVICSFQFIEHIDSLANFLRNVNNLLSNDGIFICSTPNIKDASPSSDKPLNKFHLKEYALNEFKELLGAYFKEIDTFGIKRGKQLNFYRRLKKIGLFNFLPPSANPVNRFYNRINWANFIIVKNNLDTALDFIAVCRK